MREGGGTFPGVSHFRKRASEFIGCPGIFLATM
jgi:hypothetical protein